MPGFQCGLVLGGFRRRILSVQVTAKLEHAARARQNAPNAVQCLHNNLWRLLFFAAPSLRLVCRIFVHILKVRLSGLTTFVLVVVAAEIPSRWQRRGVHSVGVIFVMG